jgi:hypothetical protein
MAIQNGSPPREEAEELREMALRARRIAAAAPSPRDRQMLLDFARDCEADARALLSPPRRVKRAA